MPELWRRRLPLGDVYIGGREGRWYVGYIRRKRTGVLEVACTEARHPSALREDFLDRYLAQRDTLEGKNPYCRMGVSSVRTR